MKIIAIVRTRNEEKNIARCCLAYLESGLADVVYVADGGSDDATVQIAKSIDGVKVQNFEERVEMENGLWRNPHGRHINFMSDWAFEDGADWVIFEDCDCIPNYLLKKYGRGFFYAGQHEAIFVVRIYIKGDDCYCPLLSQPIEVDEWYPTIWAWSRKSGIRASEENPIAHEFDKANFPQSTCHRYELYPPFALLHFAWPDADTTQAKMDFYRESGEIPGIKHPDIYAGPCEPLLEWMRE